MPEEWRSRIITELIKVLLVEWLNGGGADRVKSQTYD